MMNFQELGLSAELVRAVQDLGFVKPMAIQEQAIPILLNGPQDMVGLAQTGTGKTGAFGLPLLQRIERSVMRPQALVLCPTRELCIQITGDMQRFSRHMPGVHTVAVYGGAPIVNQMRQLKRGAQIVVATPGRLADLLQRKALSLSKVSVAVLDEADEMLNMGFQEEIDRILDMLPPQRQIWLFSATMPGAVAATAEKYLQDPVRIALGGKHRSPKNIDHTCYVIREKDRYEALKRVLDFYPGIFGLVFCRTRKETQEIAARLMQDGYNTDALHGDLSQAQRDVVMHKFREASIRILAATDVAARGLDVDDITHVLHYNLPDEPEVYTHRSGRTARAGKTGASIALINLKEKYRIHSIEKRCGIRFDLAKLPGGAEICKKQLLSRIGKIVDTKVEETDVADYLPDVFDALRGIDKEDLIKRLVISEFRPLIDYYRRTGDINAQTRTAGTTGVSKAKNRLKNSAGPMKTKRFFINAGRIDRINEGAIVRLICDKSGIPSHMIGQIDLRREFSYFEVAHPGADRVLRFMRKARLDDKAVEVREIVEKKRVRRAVPVGQRNRRYRRHVS